jgi:hypothetical protein
METTQTPLHPVLTWSAASGHDHERTLHWYIGGGVLVLAIAVYAILTSDYTLALVTLLLGGVYFLVRNHRLPLRTIQITERGVSYEGEFTPWSDCQEFWILQTPLANELHVLKRCGVNREIALQTNGVEVEPLRTLLSQFLPENRSRKERWVDKIIRFSKL